MNRDRYIRQLVRAYKRQGLTHERALHRLASLGYSFEQAVYALRNYSRRDEHSKSSKRA